MKRKVKRETSTSGTVIRTIFQEELKESETRIDAKIDVKFVAFERKMDFKLDSLERRVDEKAQQYRDQVLTSNDKLMKKLETMEQESVVGNFQRDGKLESHEKRISVLESSQKS